MLKTRNLLQRILTENINRNFSLKEIIEDYKRGEKREYKPYFRDNEMRWSQNKWWVIENGEWKEFAGRESEIEWKPRNKIL